MMIGTRYWPPQPRSGRAVAEPEGDEKNMHRETKRSAIIFAYEVSTSARRISPNFPEFEGARPPMEIRRRVVRNRVRPAEEKRRRGRTKIATRRQRKEMGR
jgi:hypothetical protein